jgi:hypothetical protein
MKVYLVTAYSIYDHGCFGVYSTLDAAKQRCQELWDVGDGHHGFRIDILEVDDSPDDLVDDVLRPDGPTGREWVLSAQPDDWFYYRRKRLEAGLDVTIEDRTKGT